MLHVEPKACEFEIGDDATGQRSSGNAGRPELPRRGEHAGASYIANLATCSCGVGHSGLCGRGLLDGAAIERAARIHHLIDLAARIRRSTRASSIGWRRRLRILPIHPTKRGVTYNPVRKLDLLAAKFGFCAFLCTRCHSRNVRLGTDFAAALYLMRSLTISYFVGCKLACHISRWGNSASIRASNSTLCVSGILAPIVTPTTEFR